MTRLLSRPRRPRVRRPNRRQNGPVLAGLQAASFSDGLQESCVSDRILADRGALRAQEPGYRHGADVMALRMATRTCLVLVTVLAASAAIPTLRAQIGLVDARKRTTPGAREFGAVWRPLTTPSTNPNWVDACDAVTDFRDVLAEICDKCFGITGAGLSAVITSYVTPGNYLGFLA